MTPLKITFTVDMPEPVLERASLLGAAADAAKEFQKAMTSAGYDVEVSAQEGSAATKRGRKPRADKGVARGTSKPNHASVTLDA
jgi:hypothetical protein